MSGSSASVPRIEIVTFTKHGGPLTKRISLRDDGSLHSDGSACTMSAGTAERTFLHSIEDLGTHLTSLTSAQAIALGRLQPDLPGKVDIVTQQRLPKASGTQRRDTIARTKDFISYAPGGPALMLLDYDTKGMPPTVKQKLEDLGGFGLALQVIMPELAQTGRALRHSTSSGISRTDTNEAILGSDGLHFFIMVKDGSDIERALRTLHDRCWLAGLGWMVLGKSGQLLERSIVDRMVYAPERLVFEGAPVLEPGIQQDAWKRRPKVREGNFLDTLSAIRTTTIPERAQLEQLKAAEAERLAPERAKKTKQYVMEQAKTLEAKGVDSATARRTIERRLKGILLPNDLLLFDTGEASTVADVLGDPEKYVGATLADPQEGIEYGPCKAKIMQRPDGSIFIHSFAHGRTVYDLKVDAKAVDVAIQKGTGEDAASVFVRLALWADLAPDELERLRNLASDRAKINKRTVDQMLKNAREEQRRDRAEHERQRRTAERRDPRPLLPAPKADAPWLPEMDVLNEVLGKSTALEPPMRDIEGVAVQVRVRRIPGMHQLTSAGANGEEAETTGLPAPEQPLLTRLNENQLAELIEQHIEHVDESDRPVHMPRAFVQHYHTRTDDVLPTAVSIATLPIVLPDGKLLAEPGLDRDRGIVFRIPQQLLDILPTPEECRADGAASDALNWLCDEWLCDVATDFTGKCILIAAALTLVERSMLAERPAFFVTAGRRGGGKTTALVMLLMAVTGVRPSAAAWSANEEERRKALLAYMLEALPAIIWDNIPRGTQIACPHIEKSCTTAFYSDRKLGVSETVMVSASLIHLFTGNNIGPRGDLASRSLSVQLEVDRADPENRPFKHPDPIAWTEAHRAQILRALYTLLLGNPALWPGPKKPAATRFKTWWYLVGSAIEYAAAPRQTLKFRGLFLAQEEDDEESASLTDALRALEAQWPAAAKFQATDLARMLNDSSQYTIDTQRDRQASLREFLFPALAANQTITAKSAGKRLHKHVGNPVKDGSETLALKVWRHPQAGPNGTVNYFVARSER